MNNFKTSLHNETTFYPEFINDLNESKSEVIIESPFITTKRMKNLFPVLNRLNNRGIKVFIITRDPKEHKPEYEHQSETEIEAFERAEIQVFLSSGNRSQSLMSRINLPQEILSKPFNSLTNEEVSQLEIAIKAL